MDVDSALKAFEDAGHDLPVDAIRWTIDNWDTVGDEMVEEVQRCARRQGATGLPASVFFISHIAAEVGDTRVHEPLCRIAHDAEVMETIFGEAADDNFTGVLISTWDGSLEPLEALIEDASADEFIRGCALDALAYLAASGRTPFDEAETYLRRLHGKVLRRSVNFIWYAWTEAVSMLRLQSLRAEADEAYERGWVDPVISDPEDFHEEFRKNLDDPDPLGGFVRAKIGPFVDTVGELSTWYWYSEEAKADEAKRIGQDPFGSLHDQRLKSPAINPFKSVGRNDPCPCGSGKKFKKCCLALAGT